MKVFKKWLIRAYGENIKIQGAIVSSFHTKRVAIDMLDSLMTPLKDGTWKSKIDGTVYKIEKNTKEYR